MNLWEDRVINGVSKTFAGKVPPDDIVESLTQDVLIHAPSYRATETDLWPSIWALAATLERQFRGEIFIDVGLERALPSPAPLGSRCHFGNASRKSHVEIAIGMAPNADAPIQLFGDARSNSISFSTLLPMERPLANPIASFAMAGYLSYAALAHTVGLPSFRWDDRVPILDLPLTGNLDLSRLQTSLSILGLGHLGNAYLALLFFIMRQSSSKPQMILIDKDRIQPSNRTTHILMPEDQSWVGRPKVEVLTKLTESWGLKTTPLRADLNWGWTAPLHSQYALVGFDNFTARRVVAAAGYDWLVESGIGTSFERPRITWHSLQPDNALAKQLFGKEPAKSVEQNFEDTSFIHKLKTVDAGCGWIIYKGIEAAAPSMGLVAAAYAWCELQVVLLGGILPIQGSAYLWSPLLPFWRRSMKN